ncbi:MAG: winged helix-turn-helix transcriptional regulator [Halobacteriales archaeon]|nr:winged helix-turn-helix transcriptional regulator [Halobacteriales archaeon]
MVLVLAAAMCAAGAAMAESAVVGGNLHTPAGDVPLADTQSSMPDTGAAQPVLGQAPKPGDAVDQANGALDENGVPLSVGLGDQVYPNVHCTPAPDPALQPAVEAACTSEPSVPIPQNDYLNVDQEGAHIGKYVKADSHDSVQKFAPDQAPSDVRDQLFAVNDAVNTAVEASIADDSVPGCDAGAICFIGGFPGGHAGGKVKEFGSKATGALAAIAAGNEESWLTGGDELLNDPGYNLGATSGSQGTGADAQSDTLGASGGADLGTMAMAAALIGAPIGGFVLYHRIRKDHTLNNKTRQAVYDGVVQHPGIGVNDAARMAGCSYSTAAYHLERLVEERLLIVGDEGRRARFFKNGGAFSQAERDFIPVLQSKEAMDVLQVIVENPWCYRAEVAQKLNVSGPTVNWHLKKLMGVGAVKEMREGRVSYLYADKKLLNQLGANLIGKVPEEHIARLRFERAPETELVEPALGLPETTVPDVGIGELELAPLAEA